MNNQKLNCYICHNQFYKNKPIKENYDYLCPKCEMQFGYDKVKSGRRLLVA